MSYSEPKMSFAEACALEDSALARRDKYMAAMGLAPYVDMRHPTDPLARNLHLPRPGLTYIHGEKPTSKRVRRRARKKAQP